MSRRRRAAALVAGVLLLAALPVGSARAESPQDARDAARAAAARVEAMAPRVDRALRAYEQALGELAGGVTRSISADQAADEAAALADDARGQNSDTVRTLYMSGGSTALLASVLDSTSANDAIRRVAYVRALVQVGSAATRTRDATTVLLRARAGRLEARADAQATTARTVQQRYDVLVAALAEAAAEFDALSERARGLEEAQALLARISALNAAVDATGAQRVATARASAVPPGFRALYVSAAKTCRGLSWSVLAAVGQVESGHGANTNDSYAGAQGPMQFMPATFAAYGVDGDRDGDRDVRDPADAVHSAANYLCANGAGRDEKSLARAIWHYNQAEWYVQLVLKLAGQYAQRDGA